MKEKIKNNYYIIIPIIIFLIFIGQLLYTGTFSHPAVDDYNYSVYTFNALKTGGIIELIKGIMKTVAEFYKTWQGTYSAIIIMSLEPAIYGQQFYFLGSFILIISLIFSTYKLTQTIVEKILLINKKYTYLITSIFLLITLETMPSIVQGLYWWNGASYYTLFYCFHLLNISLLLKTFLLKENNKKNYILSIILTILIAGSNFILALQQIILLTFLNIYLIIKKKNKKAIPLLIISIVFLLISALAPGNSIRASVVTGMSPIKAILKSFLYSGYYILKWTNILNISVILIIVFILINKTKKNIKFKYPIILSLLVYCIFSATLTPTLYASSNLGEGRLTNIIYYEYFIFGILVLYYWIGFINNKFKTNKKYKTITKYLESNKKIFYSLLIIISLISMAYKRNDITSYKIYKEFISGAITEYDKEYKERIKLLNDNSKKEVELEPFSKIPYTLFYSDISEDNESWKNIPLRTIYKKDKIVLKED